MKKTVNYFLRPSALLALIFISLSSPITIFAQSPFTGIWEGSLSVQGIELGLHFDISEDENEKLDCKLDVPMQGAKGIQATSTSAKGKELTVKFDMMNASYVGSLAENNQTIKGTWKQNGQEMELIMKKVEVAPSIDMLRPQEPKEPYPYDVSEIHFHNEAADNIELFGTLTMPKGEGPFPAVVLISGSGPQNRDEELMGHKPFLVIADHFTKNGIAVLRYDDRGVGHSKGDFSTATSVDFASDAAAAVKFLKQSPKINVNQVGLCGHSEGGMIAPIAAANSEDYAFLVLMAGPGQNIVELLLKQSELISAAMGESEEDIKKGTRVNEKIYQIVGGKGTRAERKEELKLMLKKEYENSSEKEKENGPSYEQQFAQIERQMFNPWMEYFLSYDPAVNLKKVTCPVLAINGEKDLQVAPKENLSAIESALKEGPCEDYIIQELKGLNHLFQHSETGSPAEYGTLKETFAPEALSLMTNWILEQTKVTKE